MTIIITRCDKDVLSRAMGKPEQIVWNASHNIKTLYKPDCNENSHSIFLVSTFPKQSINIHEHQSNESNVKTSFRLAVWRVIKVLLLN